MKLVEIDWNPSDRQLRQFAGLCVFVLPAVGWLWGGGTSAVLGLAAGGLVLAALGLIWPRGVRPLFLALMIVALPVGMVLGELAMLLVYFGVFLPIGLLFRLMRRDALRRKFERGLPSYWQTKSQPRNVGTYYRQT